MTTTESLGGSRSFRGVEVSTYKYDKTKNETKK
jgi:hypothetical protein